MTDNDAGTQSSDNDDNDDDDHGDGNDLRNMVVHHIAHREAVILPGSAANAEGP